MCVCVCVCVCVWYGCGGMCGGVFGCGCRHVCVGCKSVIDILNIITHVST